MEKHVNASVIAFLIAIIDLRSERYMGT